MTKKTSTYARKRAHCKPHNPDAPMNLLMRARPYEDGEMLGEHVITRTALERLRTGQGTEQDFDRVSMILNVGLIRAEAIDPELVATITAGQMALVRMKDRYLRGLGFGFDAAGLRETPTALDAYEAIMDASSPLQMIHAMRAAYARISNGDLLEIPA